MSTSPINQADIQPYKDYGIFGPESVTWKVFRYPTSFMVGFQRTVVTEMFESFLMAAVNDTNAVMSRPAARYDRTLQYVSTIAFADSETAVKSADIVFNIHTHIRGIEPLSGEEYDANDPEGQLWIHLTQWHSVLLCYEIFGPGKLSEQEENQYWEECRRAAEFQSINLDSVPRNRQEMRKYYDRMRPKMAATEVTQKTVAHLLDASAFLMDQMPSYVKPFKPAARLLFKKATIATLPKWMRKLGGIKQSPLEDAAAILAMRMMTKTMSALPESRLLEVTGGISPGAAKVVAPIVLNIPPTNPTTVTPAEAWKNAGKAMPNEQYAKVKQTRSQTPQQKAAKDPGVAHLQQLA